MSYRVKVVTYFDKWSNISDGVQLLPIFITRQTSEIELKLLLIFTNHQASEMEFKWFLI